MMANREEERTMIGIRNDNDQRENERASTSSFTMQRLSLDAAVAPLLAQPTAPFSRTERKRAHTSALYYSECVLQGIEPSVADTAAMKAQKQYKKWWENSTAKGPAAATQPTHSNSSNRSQKRRKTSSDTVDQSDALSTFSTANVVSVSSQNSKLVTRENSAATDSSDDEKLLSISEISTLGRTITTAHIQSVKGRLIEDLKSSGGNVETSGFLGCLEILEAYYRSKSWDGRGSCGKTPFSLPGNWLTLSKPTYNECRGQTTKGEYMYTLGRMGFDMFKPTQMLCSIQAAFNSVRPIDPRNPDRPLHVPKKLMKEMSQGDVNLRTYDIVVAFTIEPGQDRKGKRIQNSNGGYEYVVPKPIRGILTNHGYAVPDPTTPNRLSIWFSGGSLEVQDEPRDLDEWKKIFDSSLAPNRDLREYANILAAKLLLGALLPEGMEEDGTMSFVLKRPIGGHGCCYCDIIYMDDDLRIMRGHHGSVYVCKRVPEPSHIVCDS